MRLCDLFARVSVSGSSPIPDTDIRRIEYDSRRAGEGCLFVCLVGARSDGHNYAPSAYAQGCRAFLVCREVDLPPDAVVIRVEDTRQTLAVISAEFYGRPADRLHIIGITGTKGKTTTALMVAAILNRMGKKCAYIGSNGVTIGDTHLETVNTTPESRELHMYFDQMLRAGMEYAVLEVSSQALAHSRVYGIPFEVGVFTNLSPDHISDVEHPNFEHYAASKARLFSEYGVRYAIYNADDAMWSDMLGETDARRISFGLGKADLVARDIENYREDTTLGVRFDCVTAEGSTPVSVLSPGHFSVHNALAAMAVASVYGVSVKDSADALKTAPVQGRFEIAGNLPGRTFVIDYAHNGLSLRSALSVLREYRPVRLICVFGSVGGKSQNRRAELASAAGELSDYCIITSDNPDFESPMAIIHEIGEHLHPDCPRAEIEDREVAVRTAVRMSRPGDIVLLAGKGHETYQLIGGKKVPFRERAILEEECALVLSEENAKRTGRH